MTKMFYMKKLSEAPKHSHDPKHEYELQQPINVSTKTFVDYAVPITADCHRNVTYSYSQYSIVICIET